MIGEKRIRDYLLSLEPDGDPLCEEIAEYARMRDIPVIKRETAAFLQTLVTMKRPGAILEIGTAVGYSAILMGMAAPEECRITTIEKYAPRIAEAKINFERAGMAERIRLLEADADEVLAGLESESFEFVFMDAAKGQYGKWLPDVLRVLKPGGVLVTDNVLQDGDVVQSRFAVERRDRTIHGRMRGFLWTIKNMEELHTTVVPIGDGVAVCVKR